MEGQEVTVAMSGVFPICLQGQMVGFTAGHSGWSLPLSPGLLG